MKQTDHIKCRICQPWPADQLCEDNLLGSMLRVVPDVQKLCICCVAGETAQLFCSGSSWSQFWRYSALAVVCQPRWQPSHEIVNLPFLRVPLLLVCEPHWWTPVSCRLQQSEPSPLLYSTTSSQGHSSHIPVKPLVQQKGAQVAYAQDYYQPAQFKTGLKLL